MMSTLQLMVSLLVCDYFSLRFQVRLLQLPSAYGFFFLTFHVVETGSSNIYLCGFYFEGLNVFDIVHLILLLLVLLKLLTFHVTVGSVSVGLEFMPF